ncbi:MAG TPA: electron transfer flavoprotein subunit alpha/FixB family protein [Niabella sp.]|nr:electron transfer flavoprotein subunit alpha/FixB family protein [Niabella sp.]HQW14922.1 electron transfer flavoprotein subunit alpha/FixB family protein [Niabella sp.]HQX20186.1 electron transfer flavoprotein subunit alpha/FixB family protein [Niabella sp.]HQX42684.1 electron transfer flavoprotein subunit alpha/FixB family protein [Niabella sp.]HRB06791.1 electron transfer flavoprotein subunit alpha/FixB family protein [Niabella sp.]
MSVLIFIDIADDGTVKKSSLEALTYGRDIAQQAGTAAGAVVLKPAKEDLAGLGKYGISKIYQVANDALKNFDAQVYTHVLAQVVQSSGSDIIVFSNNADGKAIAPRLSARLKAGLVSGALALPEISNGFVVKKSVFSGKAFANIKVSSPIKIIALNPNAYKTEAGDGTAQIENFDATIPEAKVKVIIVNRQSGEVPLAEATTVVSGGRGLKGPENWGIVENLAKELHAALACSRPVADAHWRPHNEHVGQTGGAIAPNLYIAIGISGAIQHLAGVNRSKTIVVINKDPEAPFFKAADYGIVGDLFEVVPKLTEAIKQLK